MAGFGAAWALAALVGVGAPGQKEPESAWDGTPASEAELAIQLSESRVSRGGRLRVEVSTDAARTLWAQLFRLGASADHQGRLVWRGGPYATDGHCPEDGTPCASGASFEVSFQRTWPPGLYLLRISRSDGLRRFVPITVQPPTAR
jgi:hypothetical protein